MLAITLNLLYLKCNINKTDARHQVRGQTKANTGPEYRGLWLPL